MRLIECYVDGFGALSDFRQKFTDGLNVALGENGKGKTTLTVFIKSMLFGMDASGKTRGEDTDRKKYTPLTSSRYGGSLTILARGKEYRIERGFGEKPSADEFRLYDSKTGTPCNDFSEKIGEELFGIDADGFERTVFLSEKGLPMSQENKSLSARLSNLSGVSYDLGDLDRVLASLAEKEKYFMHRRGRGGLIYELEEKIAETDRRLIELSRTEEDIRETEAQMLSLSEKIRLTEAEEKRILGRKMNLAYERGYKELSDSLSVYKERAEAERRFFLGEIPSEAEIMQIERSLREIGDIENRLTELERTIGSGTPDTDTDELIREAVRLNKYKKKSLYPLHLSLAILIALASCALGFLFDKIFYTVAVLSLPFLILFIRGIRLSRGRDAAERKLYELSEQVYGLLGERREGEDLLDLIYETRARLKRSAELRDAAIKEATELREKRDLMIAETNQFFARFASTSSDPIAEIRSRLLTYNNLIECISLRERSIAELRAEYGTSESDTAAEAPETPDPDEISRRLAEERREYFALDGRVSRLTEELSSRDELKERRLELVERLDEAKEMHKIIKLTAEELLSAERRLTEKYLGNARERLKFYLSELTVGANTEIVLDFKLSLSRTDGGRTRSAELSSLGERDIYALAPRLAMIDAIYKDETPFLILDDPFAHLDDKRCSAALRSLALIGRRLQILYFTCSTARSRA